MRESEERFRNLIEGSIEGIMIHSNFKMLFVNQTYADIFGFESPDEILAVDTAFELIAPYEADRIKRYAAARLRGDDAPTSYEYEGVKKDGSAIWLDNRVRSVSWRGVPAIQSTVVEITNRKRAEEALQERERQLAEAQRLGNIGHWHFDLDAPTLFWSDELYRIYGLDPRNPVQTLDRALSLMHPEDVERYVCRRDAALNDMQEFSEEVRVIRPDGEIRHVLISGQPQFDDAGEVVAVFGTGQDITERKRAEEALRESEDRHRRFAADAAHELRTPLAVLHSNLDSLEDATVVRSLRKDVDAMTRLVEQLLASARLDFLEIGSSDQVDLREVCTNVASLLAPFAIKSKRSIEVSGCKGPVIIRGNSGYLEQAVRNLVENAIRYSPGGSMVTVKVGEDASISIIDKGPGIPHDRRDEIFQRFVRLDHSSGGAGLGLSIVQRTVQAHKGSVEIGDAPGGGAIFTLRFPL